MPATAKRLRLGITIFEISKNESNQDARFIMMRGVEGDVCNIV